MLGVMTEDHALKACLAYEEQTGHKPIFAIVDPRDFDAIQQILRHSIDPHDGKLKLGKYVLSFTVTGKTLPGQFAVTHKRIRANATVSMIKALANKPFATRLRPGGVAVKY